MVQNLMILFIDEERLICLSCSCSCHPHMFSLSQNTASIKFQKQNVVSMHSGADLRTKIKDY
jgi:hypothetical protein